MCKNKGHGTCQVDKTHRNQSCEISKFRENEGVTCVMWRHSKNLNSARQTMKFLRRRTSQNTSWKMRTQTKHLTIRQDIQKGRVDMFMLSTKINLDYICVSLWLVFLVLKKVTCLKFTALSFQGCIIIKICTYEWFVGNCFF